MEAKILEVPSTPPPFVINLLILQVLANQRASNGNFKTEAFPATMTTS